MAQANKASRKRGARKSGSGRRGTNPKRGATRKSARKSSGSRKRPAPQSRGTRTKTRAAQPRSTQNSSPRPLTRLRKLCLAFPEAHEVEAWGEPTFRVRNKLFAMYAAEGNHHGSGRPGVWLKATGFSQDLMVRTAPERFFVPPYVGPSGWVGVWLDGACDWDELADLVADAHRLTAAKVKLRLVASR